MYELKSLELRIGEIDVIFGIVKCSIEHQGRNRATIERREGEIVDVSYGDLVHGRQTKANEESRMEASRKSIPSSPVPCWFKRYTPEVQQLW